MNTRTMPGIQIPLIEIQADALQVLHDYQQKKDPNWSETVWFRVNEFLYTLTVSNNCMYNKENDIRLSLKQSKGNTVFEYRNGETLFDLCFPKLYPIFTNLPNIESNFTSLTKVDGNLVVGNSNGSLITVPYPIKISSNSYKLRSSGHYGDVLGVKTFASNSVICSFGLDMQIKIWSIKDTNELPFGEPLRVLKNVHKGRITDIVMIGKGRNIVSCGQDGRIVMWEIGSGENIWTRQRIKKLDDGCNSLDLLEMGDHEDETMDTGKFYECTNKILFCGHRSGVVTVWNLSNRLSYGEFITNGEQFAVEKLAVNDLNNIIVALSNGDLISFKYDLQTKETVENWHVNILQNQNINFKRLTTLGKSIILSVNQYLIELDMCDGTLRKAFVGMDEEINDVLINNKNFEQRDSKNDKEEMIVVGKHQFLSIFEI